MTIVNALAVIGFMTCAVVVLAGILLASDIARIQNEMRREQKNGNDCR